MLVLHSIRLIKNKCDLHTVHVYMYSFLIQLFSLLVPTWVFLHKAIVFVLLTAA